MHSGPEDLGDNLGFIDPPKLPAIGTKAQIIANKEDFIFADPLNTLNLLFMVMQKNIHPPWMNITEESRCQNQTARQ